MMALLCFFLTVLASPFKSKIRLEAENAALRHQLIVLQRKVQGRVRLTNNDRLFFVQLYRWSPLVLKAITIIRPETIVRWHRAGFRRYWRWKSRSTGGRPQIDTDLWSLIQRMSIENALGRPAHPRRTAQARALRSLSQRWPSIWSSVVDRRARDGAPSCEITPQISLPYHCSRPLASICSMPSLSFDWTVETSSGSMSQQIRRQNGSRFK
jgi:hypothetical protein